MNVWAERKKGYAICCSEMALGVFQDWSGRGVWGTWMSPVHFGGLQSERHGVVFIDLWHWPHSNLIFLWALQSLTCKGKYISFLVFEESNNGSRRNFFFLRFYLNQWVSKKPKHFLFQDLELWSLFTLIKVVVF